MLRWCSLTVSVSPAIEYLGDVEVADELMHLHTTCADVAQRPGSMAVTDLTATSRSVDADMSAIPTDATEVILGIFNSYKHIPVALIHGDPNASNIRITNDGRVALLDWDESRVDVVWHDLSNLGIQVLGDVDHERAQRLSNAWETANAWVAEPEYAQRRYAALGGSEPPLSSSPGQFVAAVHESPLDVPHRRIPGCRKELRARCPSIDRTEFVG
jgi:Phosphotransferase enzyme family